jgi:Lysozyme like domain
VRWDAVELARFARNAGFHRDDVPVAAALALATSGGIDTYCFQPGSPGSGHYVGLWGVDVDRWPDYATRVLYAPQVNAQVAYELHQLYGGWSWMPAYDKGAHLGYVAHAATEATREVHAQTAPQSEVPMHARGEVARLVDGTARRSVMLNDVRMFRR